MGAGNGFLTQQPYSSLLGLAKRKERAELSGTHVLCLSLSAESSLKEIPQFKGMVMLVGVPRV